MNRTFKVGDLVWHGSRYWKTDNLTTGEVPGWNTEYIAYSVQKITEKRIIVINGAIGQRLHLNRQAMERDGKQYHTLFHEYFYAEKPKPNSKDWNWEGSQPVFRADCFQVLGIGLPCSRAEVRRAYKRLALKLHPDLGGSNADFIKLKQAHDSALRFAQA